MKILFVMLHPGYARNYESMIRLLAERGHDIHLSFNMPLKQVDDGLIDRLKSECSRITFSYPPNRNDIWSSFAKLIRGSMDYLRYLTPQFSHAELLRRRIEQRLPAPLWGMFAFIDRRFGSVAIKFVKDCLLVADRAIPTSGAIHRFVKSCKPDVVLVTPLVNIASEQVEYLKSAKTLGIRTALCVASWDNLTNKGLIRGDPDQVIVWNEIQKREAVELHDIPPHRVVITGAQCYDKWFDRRPGTTREEFCCKVGLQPQKDFVLYLCSSPFIAGDREVAFVEHWIKAIRGSADVRLRDIGILVRPHPQNANQWRGVDLSHFGNVSIYPRLGANPVDECSRSDYFDSMYHSVAVVGINTSALIEVGILGKPVYTVLAPEFKGAQEGTLHFHYLISGGLLRVSENLKEHVENLAEEISRDADHHGDVRGFLRDFIRPHGLDIPCTPIIVDEIERLGTSAPPAGAKTGVRVLLLRGLTFPISVLVLVLEALWKWRRSHTRRKTELIRIREAGLAGLEDTEDTMDGRSRSLLGSFLRMTRRLAGATLRSVGLGWLIPYLKRIVPESVKEGAAILECRHEIHRVKEKIGQITTGSEPVLVGPWLSEVGFEVLYWIPFLHWVTERYKISRDRLIVVSRGGASAWYEGLFSKYVDIFEYFTPEEFYAKNVQRVQQAGGQKHREVSDFDHEIIERVKQTFGFHHIDVLHPSLMYNLFVFFWRGGVPINLVLQHTRHSWLAGGNGEIIPGLPKDYFAAKFYFSNCFPDTEANRSFILKTLSRLSERNHVVLLNTNLRIDDHTDCDSIVREKVHDISHLMTAKNNLEVQTRIISGARGFIGTYGGFSYVAPLYGVPCVAFYSKEDGFLPVHLEVGRRVFSTMGGGPFIPLSTRNVDMLELILG